METKSITIEDMLRFSQELYKKHEGEWPEATPESNIMWLCWLVSEVGEVIDIVKKKGTEKIMSDVETRQHMLEEITDCYMHLADIVNRYQYTAEEFSEAYTTKMKRNFERSWKKD